MNIKFIINKEILRDKIKHDMIYILHTTIDLLIKISFCNYFIILQSINIPNFKRWNDKETLYYYCTQLFNNGISIIDMLNLVCFYKLNIYLYINDKSYPLQSDGLISILRKVVFLKLISQLIKCFTKFKTTFIGK